MCHYCMFQCLINSCLGALERHETGDAAKAILSSCDDSQAVLIDTRVPIPAGARPNHLHQRNHLHCKATSSFKHNTLAATNIQADRTQEKVGKILIELL